MKTKQEVMVRLFFDDVFFEKYQKSHKDILSEYGLDIRGLPSPDDKGVISERRGRRLLLAKEIYRYYYPAIHDLGINSIDEFSNSKILSEFCRSTSFLSEINFIPSHDENIYGYENISKFYHFIESNEINDSNTFDIGFCQFLVGWSKHYSFPPFSYFKNGSIVAFKGRNYLITHDNTKVTLKDDLPIENLKDNVKIFSEFKIDIKNIYPLTTTR
ncbi:hypothetical protein [Aliivibrio fischeri]|uniref:hypothetical protein n=1 Tax=Aliivibrio fischeri TaxID=668 RepID=UPI00080EB145|nr:hypothetical protein [Aliivibrio fischeri]OCH38011.1 hypothetical protein A6D99_12975 [Aliivibrio fischeri]